MLMRSAILCISLCFARWQMRRSWVARPAAITCRHPVGQLEHERRRETERAGEEERAEDTSRGPAEFLRRASVTSTGRRSSAVPTRRGEREGRCECLLDGTDLSHRKLRRVVSVPLALCRSYGFKILWCPVCTPPREALTKMATVHRAPLNTKE